MANDGRTIPTNKDQDLPTFKIMSNGEQVTNEYQVASILVEKAVNRLSSAQIILFDGDAAAETFHISNALDFEPGREIEIHVGYHGDDSVIFKGIIVGQHVKVHQSHPSVLTVDCRDAAFRMNLSRRTNYFYDSTDSDIIEDIARKNNLSVDVSSMRVTHRQMVQHYASDWDFIVSRAEANGRYITTEDGRLVVKAPDFGQDPILKLQNGGNVLDFELEMDARLQPENLTAIGWNTQDLNLSEVEANDARPRVPGNISPTNLAKSIGLKQMDIRHGGRMDDSELQEWANAHLLRRRMAKVCGRIHTQGFPDIKPAQLVELSGMGDRFNGVTYVSAVRHELSVSNYETHIIIGVPPQYHAEEYKDIAPPAAHGLLPAVCGLQFGLVTRLENDPDGEHRVQVRVPLVDQKGEGVWARVATLDAGAERGTFFRPEIGDEVILGFVDDDPRQAVILGMLHSSKKAAPATAKDDNHQKGYVSRSKMKFWFDDEKGEITLSTPDEQQSITMSRDAKKMAFVDKANGNKIEMSSSGILIESQKDIKIKANMEISAEAQTNLALKAQTQLTAKGGSSAEISSNGVTTVKGSSATMVG